MIKKSLDDWEEKSIEQLRRFKTYTPYSFNINDLLVDPNDPTVFDMDNQSKYYGLDAYLLIPDPAFCRDLRDCIEKNIKENEKCLLSYKVKPGTVFSPLSIYSSISRCPIVDIKEELSNGTERKICKFNQINAIKKIGEDELSIINYEPFIHNCYLPEDLGKNNVIDTNDTMFYLYSGRGNIIGYSFENGGTVRIVMTNVSIKNDPYANCSYSLYICGQNAIAATEEETPVEIFKIIQGLDEKELYFNETIFWGGPTPSDVTDLGWFSLWLIKFMLGFGGIPDPPKPSNLYGYYPRTYDFNFSGTCSARGTCDKALIDTIDAGMWEWSKANFENKESMKYYQSQFNGQPENIHFSFSPINPAYIVVDNTLSFNSGCWKNQYEKITSNTELTNRLAIDFNKPEFSESESFKNNFKFNNLNIGDKIRMVLGTKKIFISDKKFTVTTSLIPWLWVVSTTTSILDEVNNQYDPDIKSRVILVMDPITFCSE